MDYRGRPRRGITTLGFGVRSRTRYVLVDSAIELRMEAKTMTAPFARELELRRAEIARICAELGVRRLELFGSGTRSASPADLDFLVDLGERPPSEYAAAYFALRERLEALFAKPIDLVTPPGLANPYFRQRVEQEKTLLYAA